MKRKGLRGTKITGSWDSKGPGRGKRCEITSAGDHDAGARGRTVMIRDVKECADVCGSHWFEKDTLRFFKSRVADVAYLDGKGGAYFTSSEKGPNDIRAYSVRHYSADRCGIDTVGKFQAYTTKAAADRAARTRAHHGPPLDGAKRKGRR